MARSDTQGKSFTPLRPHRRVKPHCLFLVFVPLLSSTLGAQPAGAQGTLDAAPRVTERAGIQEVEGEIRSPYINHDLAPARLRDRKWAMKDIAALWISMCACVPTYMLASSLIAEGMNWWQAVLTIFLGNVIVLVPMVLNGHAGTRYGIPFPVYCRASFGVRGANVPALLRALIAVFDLNGVTPTAERAFRPYVIK